MCTHHMWDLPDTPCCTIDGPHTTHRYEVGAPMLDAEGGGDD